MGGKSIVIIVAAIIVVVVLLYVLVPPVRYFLIPVTGKIKAPELTAVKPSANQNKLFVPGTFANAQELVSRIENVPAEGGWINTAPLDFKSLYSQNNYILFDFWTYTCINCIRATPYTQELWDRYRGHGLVVIGVHSPEFQSIERDPRNIFTAMQRAHITYPVLTDADHVTWNKFGNKYWPGKYLVSPGGQVVYTQFGEGNYEGEEQRVRQELTKAGWKLPDYGPGPKHLEPVSKTETPELYAGPGFVRRPYGNKEQPVAGSETVFTMPATIQPDRIYLEGTWNGAHDYVASRSTGEIVLNYVASAPYIVLARENQPLTIEVLLDGQPVPAGFRGSDIQAKDGTTVMTVDEARLYYPIAATAPYGRHTITFKVPPGTHFYSFTFGVY
jgi:thiol-disulfide isomerase/thioredoxin